MFRVDAFVLVFALLAFLAGAEIGPASGQSLEVPDAAGVSSGSAGGPADGASDVGPDAAGSALPQSAVDDLTGGVAPTLGEGADDLANSSLGTLEDFAELGIELDLPDGLSEPPTLLADRLLAAPRRASGESAEDHLPREVLILDPSTDMLQDLQARGFALISIDRLDALDADLARLHTPDGVSVAEARAAIEDRFPEIRVDLNSLFVRNQAELLSAPSDIHQLIGWPRRCSLDLRIGMIDTTVDPVAIHPDVSLRQRTFGTVPEIPPGMHGTAVAAILAGTGETPRHGMLTGIGLYAAAAFEPQSDRPSATHDLVFALDWLAERQVRLVNLSFAGPRNGIVEVMLNRLTGQGTVVVASVGHGPPDTVAPFPAAMPSVIAVTAVDGASQILPSARQGNFVDFAAPGVAVPSLGIDGQSLRATGTSFAAPFVTAAAALHLVGGTAPSSISDRLAGQASDLGTTGHDPVFGHGLVRAPECPGGAVAAGDG